MHFILKQLHTCIWSILITHSFLTSFINFSFISLNLLVKTFRYEMFSFVYYDHMVCHAYKIQCGSSFMCMYICLSQFIYLKFYWKYILLSSKKKIFDPQCFLPATYARTIMTQSFWMCPANDWSNFRPMPLERAHANTAWMAWTWKLDVSET